MKTTARKPKAKENVRIKTILVPTDFSEESRKALEYGRALLSTFGGSVHLVHAQETDLSYTLPVMTGASAALASRDALEETVRRRLGELARKYSFARKKEERHLRTGRAYDAICTVASEIKADLIVIGTHGYGGWKRLLLGSTAERVVQHAPCPVMVVRERERDFLESAGPGSKEPSIRVKKIVAPVDFSACSREGARYAIDFAAKCGAHLTVLHTLQVQPLIPSDTMAELAHTPSPGVIERAAKMEMRKFLKQLDFGEVEHDARIRAGRAALEICQFAERQNADLIITSTHGATGLEHVLIGSTAERVVRYAPCPVLVVPSKGRGGRS